MRSGETEGAGPVFCAGESGGMDHEFVGLRVECRCGFQTAEKSPVANFGLGVCADDLAGLHEGHPIRSLFGGGLESQCRTEHHRVVAEGGGDDHVVFMGVGVKDSVTVLQLVLHEHFPKVEPFEVLSFAALVGVCFWELRGIGEPKGILDSSEGRFAAFCGVFPGEQLAHGSGFPLIITKTREALFKAQEG